MDEDAFWQLIDECGSPTPDPEGERLAAALTARLVQGPVATVVGFAERLSEVMYRLDRRDLGEDLSGDAFLYTRAAVVAAGRRVYERVLSEPRRFAPFAENLVWAEALLYVPDDAYEQLTGEAWNRDTRYSYESYSNTTAWAED